MIPPMMTNKIFKVFMPLLAIVLISSVQQLDARKKHRESKAPPAKWASSFQAFGTVVTNDSMRSNYRTGVGGALRIGYGFWSGFSLDGELNVDVLVSENSNSTDDGHKTLISTGVGPRYSFYILEDDISLYGTLFVGLTVDLTKEKDTSVDFYWSPAMGLDVHLSEELTIGPLFKYRHVVSDTDIHLFNFGVAATYIFK